jgi:lipase chaperone LimK
MISDAAVAFDGQRLDLRVRLISEETSQRMAEMNARKHDLSDR